MYSLKDLRINTLKKVIVQLERTIRKQHLKITRLEDDLKKEKIHSESRGDKREFEKEDQITGEKSE